MKTLKHVIKENKSLYLVLMVVFGMNLGVQLSVQYTFNKETFPLIAMILTLSFSSLWLVINAIVLPYTTFRFSVLFNGDRNEGYQRMSQFLDVSIIICSIIMYVALWFVYDDMVNLKWLFTGHSLDLFKLMLIIVFAAYAMVQTLLYVVAVFYRTTPLRGIGMISVILVALGIFLTVFILIGDGVKFPYLMIGLIATGVLFKVKAFQAFLKCEFSS